jgi:hypothetical protein
MEGVVIVLSSHLINMYPPLLIKLAVWNSSKLS